MNLKNINKLYKYRPISSLLFKELYYQELYFASYYELNDPLDLFTRIEFSTKEKTEIEYLIWFLFKSQINFEQKNNFSELINLYEKDKKMLRDEIYKSIIQTAKTKKNIWFADILLIINKSLKKINSNLKIDENKFEMEIESITKQFLKNSYIYSLSETNNNFLMWSHYANNHKGICLEFSIDKLHRFPFEKQKKRHINNDKFKNNFSEWDTKSVIYWDKIHKVRYEKEQSYINFYEFSKLFENEYNPDLSGQNKLWIYEYALKLKNKFLVKLMNWKYEKEWRAIHVNFTKPKEPEERIYHYPIEALTSVYFGVNTPLNDKKRIYKIINDKSDHINFYKAHLNGSEIIDFTLWEYPTD